MTRALALLTTAAALAPGLAAADWLAFRGDGSSVAPPEAAPPIEWSVESGSNVAWRANLPGRGVSGPIVAAGKVILTASDGPERERLHVLAFDASSGKRLWSRRMWATGRPNCHETSANAAPTPASDGSAVFAFYSSNDLAAISLDGDLLWVRGLVLDHPGVGNDIGMASSPVVAGDAVVVQAECKTNSFAIAVDRLTGKTLWEVERPKGSNWASPLPWTTETGEQAVWLQSGYGASLFDAATGEVLARIEADSGSIPSPTRTADGLLVLPSGGVSAFEAPFERDAAPVHRLSQLRPGSPTPVVVGDQVLVINRGGVLTSGSLATGEVNWRKRLGGSYWATPVVAQDRAYCVDSKGNATVVDLQDRGRVLCKTAFGEDVLGSPAVSGDAVYFRSHGHLWKIAAPLQASLESRRR